MANSDKDIIITPNRSSSTDDPKVEYRGANSSVGPQTITSRVYPTSNGTLSFEGSAGQLFSITNSLTGTIFSVNDVSGIPSIEVLDTGVVKLAQYAGNVLIGTGTNNTGELQITGNTWNNATGGDLVVRNTSTIGSALTLMPTNSGSFSAGWSLYAGASGASIGDGAFGFWNHTAQAQRFYTTQAGDVFAASSYRAPIFYDSDNTNYYINPRTTSILSGLKLDGIDNDASGTDAILWINKPNNNDWAMIVSGGLEYGIDLQMASSHSYALRAQKSGSGEYSRLGSDMFYHLTEIRAPIFKDYNDANYYVDPAGTSSFNSMYINGSVGGISNSSSYTEAAIEVRERNFGGAQDDTWATAPRISFHWAGRVASQIGMSSGGRISILNNPGNGYENFQAANIYGAVFVDSGDNNYYLDPTSTTALRTVGSWRADSATWDGEFAGKIQYHSTHWYFQAAGYWYFRNAAGTNVASFDNSGNLSCAYVSGTYFNASSGNSENPTIGQIWTQNTSDNYLRKSTPAHFISNLGILTTSNWTSTITTTQGIQGRQGIQGTSGTNGTNGSNGSQGIQGIQGTSGTNGTNGSNGSQGIQGVQGIQGRQGISGTNGSNGSNGSQGIQGIQGSSGSGSTSATPNTIAQRDSLANIYANNFYSVSDATVKENITPIANPLFIVKNMQGVKYTRKGSNIIQSGLLAQDIEKVLPEAVTTKDNLKVVSYDSITGVLVEAIKEQNENQKVQEERINKLEQLLAKIAEKILN